jgi:hypothetical protein
LTLRKRPAFLFRPLGEASPRFVTNLPLPSFMPLLGISTDGF